MTSITYQFVTLLLLISSIVCPTESHYKEKDRDRKRERTTYSAYPSATTVASVNLCSKNRDLKLVCHCSPDDEAGKARKAECWIFHTELMRHDSNWLTFHTQTNLEHLRIVIQSIGVLKYVPSEALRLLKHLKALSIDYGQIEDIQSYAFGNLTKLQNITLANNQIRFVYRHAFANHPVLEEIDLHDNGIIDVDREAFVNLGQLARLNLARNNLSMLHDDMFQELGNLKEINLQLNDIDKLTRESFKGLGNLRYLDLSENRLSFIGDTVFAELWSLQELYLDSNTIEKISERAFDGLNNLKILNLHSNRLKMLERGLFVSAPAVKTLNLADNLLETLTFNNMLPLMDNLVNHTSVLTITGNKFICDCRLSWMFDVRSRTKNDDLHRTLGRVKCFLEPSGLQPLGQVEMFDNSINEHSMRRPGSGSGMAMTDEDVAYDDEEVADATTTGTIDLFKMGVSSLPCPEELADPTELPLSHKSVGMDLSWLTQHSSMAHQPILNRFVLLSWIGLLGVQIL